MSPTLKSFQQSLIFPYTIAPSNRLPAGIKEDMTITALLGMAPSTQDLRLATSCSGVSGVEVCTATLARLGLEGDPQAGSGAQAGMLETTQRDDGTTQVTYDGHPLYYYVDDPKGEVACHNISEFGGLWLAVQGNGQPVS